MNKTAVLLLVTGFSMWTYILNANDVKTVRGEDKIIMPAKGEGLYVNNLFQSNMVLQRDKPIAVWGWAKPGEAVKVEFDGKEQTAEAADDGSWKVEFPALPASANPKTMVIKGSDKTINLENILIGDVWVLGGQSNMEFPIHKVQNGQLEIISANLPNIRILSIPQENGPDPKKNFPKIYQWSGWSKRHFRKGFWDVCSPDTVKELSAIGYVFARRLQMATQIPIGVIDVSRGGTTVETWTPIEVLKSIDSPEVKMKLEEWDKKVSEFDPQKDLEDQIKRYNQWVERMKKQGKKIPPNRKAPTEPRPGPAMDQNRPGNCYASMMAPLEGLQVKGAIWHQGYNNCFDGSRGAKMYYDIFPEMISSWRKAFNNPEMAFGILSLCTQGTRQRLENFSSQMIDAGPYIREAQYKTFEDMYKAGDKNIGFTVTYDLRRRWYHPQLKVPAGERIARWALATQYGFEKEIKWKPPMIQKMEVKDGTIILDFDQATSAIDDGGPIEGFAIAGADGKFYPAIAKNKVTGKDQRGRDKKDMNSIVLSSPMVPEPKHFRYAWARMPMANVQAHHNTDIPIGTQRSDTWTLNDMYEAYVGKKAVDPNTLDRKERRELQNALKASDLERQLKEAETLIKDNTKK